MTTLEKAIKFFNNEYEEVKRDLERADLLEHKKEIEQWIAEGKNDCMEYAERYCDLRNNPCILFLKK